MPQILILSKQAPALAWPKLKIGSRLLARRAGFRNLLDVIGLDTSIVRGSHGRPTTDPQNMPVLLSSEAGLVPREPVAATDVKRLLLSHLFGEG